MLSAIKHIEKIMSKNFFRQEVFQITKHSFDEIFQSLSKNHNTQFWGFNQIQNLYSFQICVIYQKSETLYRVFYYYLNTLYTHIHRIYRLKKKLQRIL